MFLQCAAIGTLRWFYGNAVQTMFCFCRADMPKISPGQIKSL